MSHRVSPPPSAARSSPAARRNPTPSSARTPCRCSGLQPDRSAGRVPHPAGRVRAATGTDRTPPTLPASDPLAIHAFSRGGLLGPASTGGPSVAAPGCVAAPTYGRWPPTLRQGRTDRVEIHVRRTGQQRTLVQQPHGPVAALPEAAGTPVLPVCLAGNGSAKHRMNHDRLDNRCRRSCNAAGLPAGGLPHTVPSRYAWGGTS